MEGITIADFRALNCYYYIAEVKSPIREHVHDGDTFTAVLDLGIDQRFHNFKVRPVGYNSPEVVGAQRRDGLEARDFLIGLFEEIEERWGKPWIALQTIKNDKEQERMTGARYLAHVWVPGYDGVLRDLSKLMQAAGMGVRA